MSDLILSSSSVAAWLDCHLRWWFDYVALRPAPVDERLQTGIDVHAQVEWLLRLKQGSWLYDKSNPRPPASPAVMELATLYERQVLWRVEPVLVEAEYQFNLDGVTYQSILDAADDQGVVIDLKTSASRPGKDGRRYRLSMIGHAIGYRVLMAKEETGRRLDYLIRTKTPYYWPVELDPIDDDDYDYFSATLYEVAEGIDRGEYAPTGLDSPWACATCPHKAACGPYQRMKENE